MALILVHFFGFPILLIFEDQEEHFANTATIQ